VSTWVTPKRVLSTVFRSPMATRLLELITSSFRAMPTAQVVLRDGVASVACATTPRDR
jgi:hypothetical protein